MSKNLIIDGNEYTDISNIVVPLADGPGAAIFEDIDEKNYATVEYVDGAIEAIPAPDYTGLATEDYVDEAIGAIPAPDYTGLATEEYVTNAISEIPEPDYTGLATEAYVDHAVANSGGGPLALTIKMESNFDITIFAGNTESWQCPSYEFTPEVDGSYMPPNIYAIGKYTTDSNETHIIPVNWRISERIFSYPDGSEKTNLCVYFSIPEIMEYDVVVTAYSNYPFRYIGM